MISRHRRSDPKPISQRYPYTITLALLASEMLAVWWLFTHNASVTPLWNALAFTWMAAGCPLALGVLISKQ